MRMHLRWDSPIPLFQRLGSVPGQICFPTVPVRSGLKKFWRTSLLRKHQRHSSCCALKPIALILQRDPSDGALVAFMLVFRVGKRVINKFIGLDYSRLAGCYPYFRLFDAALDFAYGCGASELQSGQTGYRAKLDLGHRLVPLFNAFHHKNPLIHSLFRAIGSRVTWKSQNGDLAGAPAGPPRASEIAPMVRPVFGWATR